jgi:N-acetyl-anhydromuramoyl-L-alanine amidase
MTSTKDLWLPGARRSPSPNTDARSPGCSVDLLVIHNISLPPGEFGGPYIEDLFHNRLDPTCHPYFAEIAHLRVSAHLLIRRDGTLIQFVPLDRRAWHAGQSRFGDRDACNDFSIGIELEGTDDRPFDDRQYVVLQTATREIRARFPTITPDRVVGHCDIAPGHKSDPGPCFDWSRFRQGLEPASGDL